MRAKKHRGIVVLRVQGSSMSPTLNDNSWVLVRWGKKPKVNDVVVARSPIEGSLIIKRLIRIEDDGFWLQGDGMSDSSASSSQDSWVFGSLKPEEILGVVIWPRIS